MKSKNNKKTKNNRKTIMGSIMIVMALSIIVGSVFADFGENGLISLGESNASSEEDFTEEDSSESNLEEFGLDDDLLEEVDFEDLDEDIKEILEEEFEGYESNMTEDEDQSMIMPPYYLKKNFIMYTDDGTHVMWGEIHPDVYSNVVAEGEDIFTEYSYSYFTSKDSDGRKAFGVIKGNEFFGFYDYDYSYDSYRNKKVFFHGSIYGNEWKAQGLFGLKSGHGKIKMFYQDYDYPAYATDKPRVTEPEYDMDDYDEKPEYDLEYSETKPEHTEKPNYKRPDLKNLSRK